MPPGRWSCSSWRPWVSSVCVPRSRPSMWTTTCCKPILKTPTTISSCAVRVTSLVFGATTTVFPSDVAVQRFLTSQGRGAAWVELTADADAIYATTTKRSICLRAGAAAPAQWLTDCRRPELWARVQPGTRRPGATVPGGQGGAGAQFCPYSPTEPDQFRHSPAHLY